jgi:hypothetical protein
MWLGFGLFTFGLVLNLMLGGAWIATAIVFIGVIAYLIGAFEIAEELHDVESKRFVNSRTDIIFATSTRTTSSCSPASASSSSVRAW